MNIVKKLKILQYIILLSITTTVLIMVSLLGITIPTIYDNPEFMRTVEYNIYTMSILIVGIIMLILLVISYIIGSKIIKKKNKGDIENAIDKNT